MKPIFTAIFELLKFQSSCTLPTIAKLSGKKQMEVLKCVNNNADLIIKDKKGNILGLVDVIAQQRKAAFDRGESYVVNEINYGSQQIFRTKNKAAESLKESYICGGLGNSYTVKEILKTPKNEQALDKLGILPYNGVRVKTISELWIEP